MTADCASRVRRCARSGSALLLALSFGVLVTGCGSMPKSWWPFGSKPPTGLPLAEEVAFERPGLVGTDAPAFPQYWKRNTLLIDLQGLGGSGELVLRSTREEGWPARIALRVAPGAIERLEVRGEQRHVWSIDAGAKPPLDLELAPGTYRAKTPEIRILWGPAGAALRPSGPATMQPSSSPPPSDGEAMPQASAPGA